MEVSVKIFMDISTDASVKPSTEASVDVSDLHHGRSPEASMEASVELHENFHGRVHGCSRRGADENFHQLLLWKVSTETFTGAGCMELSQKLHGTPWTPTGFHGPSRNFHGSVVELHGAHGNAHGAPTEVHGSFRVTPCNSVELRVTPCNSVELRRTPWNSVELRKVLKKGKGPSSSEDTQKATLPRPDPHKE